MYHMASLTLIRNKVLLQVAAALDVIRVKFD